MTRSFQIVSDPKKRIEVTLIVPADKSISHRSIIFSSLATGKTEINNFLTAEDCLHTASIFSELGVPINRKDNSVFVNGVGLRGLKPSSSILDVGNSGTGMRLILGVLAGQSFESIITGDESIQKRPMQRVTQPLQKMGASFFVKSSSDEWIVASETGNVLAPLKVKGSRHLRALNYSMPVASAQIKSAVLLAGLFADGVTSVTDPGWSRDHTERMMAQFGLPILVNKNMTSISPVESFQSPGKIIVPSDISSAAFWIVLGLILPKATIRLPHIGLNPSRTGVIEALQLMGAQIKIENHQQVEGEPVGDLIIESSTLTAIRIEGEIIPRLIDEIPILAVAAAFGQGVTEIRDAQELRVKESDRIKTTALMLEAFGVPVEELPDGLRITGGAQLHNGVVESHGDHRIAMAASILALAIGGSSSIMNIDCVATSYPSFSQSLLQISQKGMLS